VELFYYASYFNELKLKELQSKKIALASSLIVRRSSKEDEIRYRCLVIGLHRQHWLVSSDSNVNCF
jgi:hypothetical protein